MAPYRAGDIILDRYLPNAVAEEREEAREHLRRLVRLILRVHMRLNACDLLSEIRGSASLEVESGSNHHDV
jgi:hypothetical protein